MDNDKLMVAQEELKAKLQEIAVQSPCWKRIRIS